MRASEILMVIELALEGELVTYVSVYAPQVGRPQEEKDEFYDELYSFIGKLKGKYVVVGDMNGHVGRDVDGLRVCMAEMGLEIIMQKVKPFLNLPRNVKPFLNFSHNVKPFLNLPSNVKPFLNLPRALALLQTHFS